jgi:hypothetical protein
VAIDDGLVVGFASGVHYIHPDKPPELWVNALLHALFDVGRVHNCRTAWVLTCRDNVAAMALYTSVGGTEGTDDSGPAAAMVGYTFDLLRAE